MLKLSKVRAWLVGLFAENTCELSDDIYDDVMPSGVHHTSRSEY